MPKKTPRNAFYFFMVHFKEEQKKKGINYGNMANVAEAAGNVWKEASPSERSKFEEIAAKEKKKMRAPENKFTSNGYSLAEIDQIQQAQEQAMENERRDVWSMVNSRQFSEKVTEMDMFLMDVNFFCKVNNNYLIGESTLVRFNLQEGIKDSYHELINPGKIPMGYVSDVKVNSQELGLDMPDESAKRCNFMHILAQIVDYCRQQDPKSEVLSPIFTIPEKVEPVFNFIQQMCRQAGEDETLFRVYKLDYLFFTLINSLKTRPDEGFPKESLAKAQLKKDPFKYTPGISCKHHKGGDKYMECSESRAKRWAFTVLDSCCPVAGVDAKPGMHVPVDFDLPSIHVFQEQKKTRRPPTVAGHEASSPWNMSMVSDCRDTSMSDYSNQSFDRSESTTSYSKKGRVHVPLRMPKTDFSVSIEGAPDLKLEEDFPKLGALPKKHGRDRGVSSSFDKLKLDQ